MKNYTKLILAFTLLLFVSSIFAQVPQRMSYQSVIRNSGGQLVINTPISVKISILLNSSTGQSVYSETHNLTTNVNGLATLEVGGGNVLTGSFANVNWGAGSYFIKTETDVNGGTNYNIVGTSQLLSVPFAFYSANSQQQGKTSIYLTGNISNTEASAKIAAEFGPNTENLYIVNTTSLTSVDLSMMTNLIHLDIRNNTSLNSVNFSSLSSVYQFFSISSNPNLSSLSFPALVDSPQIGIVYNDLLSTVSFPLLNKAPGILINYNNALASIALNSLVTTTSSIQFGANPNLNSISLPLLNKTQSLSIMGTKISSLSLPSLISGDVGVQNNPLLTMVNIGVWGTTSQSLYNSMTINGNSLLTSITLPILVAGGSAYFDFTSNALPSNQINYILNKLVTVVPNSLRLENQIPPAPPTGQGIIDKTILSNAGTYVTTD